MPPKILHLHTYFLFPFSIDRQTVMADHPEIWTRHARWMDGLDEWIAAHSAASSSPLVAALGPWRRSPYTRFDMESPAYQDMVFFHPIVRRVFFDTSGAGTEAKEALLRCYRIPLDSESKLWFEAEDQKNRAAAVQVTDLRLFLFANGIGILSLGVEAFDLPAPQALWINENLRKVYPSSGRQIREARIPCRMAFRLERNGSRQTIVEERFDRCDMIGFQPPLAATIRTLLYFADYEREEYEPVLDERMVIYTYLTVDPHSVDDDYAHSEAYQQLLSRFLYVDRWGDGYRYEPDFVREQMQRQVYRRWAHQGTYYGFTSYSNVTCAIGIHDCDDHVLREGFLIHRMFDTRYYLMALVALFYRATLLEFSERTALVSKQLYLDHEDGRFTRENIRLASDLRAEFLHFANYWHFDELANKDEELGHFQLMCREYRTEPMKREIEEEIEKLNASLHNYYQFRNTEAVNRLAMLSLMLGLGAVATGFFGMNFGHYFGRWFFEPDPASLPVHYAALSLVVLVVIGALSFGFCVVWRNWSDYREILIENERPREAASLKRGPAPASRGG